MKIYDKKTSLLKANIKDAEALSAQLLVLKTPKGKQLFERVEITNGFEIRGKRIIDNKWCPAIFLRYTDNDGMKLLEWDSYAITID